MYRTSHPPVKHAQTVLSYRSADAPYHQRVFASLLHGLEGLPARVGSATAAVRLAERTGSPLRQMSARSRPGLKEQTR